MFPLKHLKRSSRGQVLILALLVMVILIFAVMVFFDVQRIMRGKMKVMSGVDAAALTGANWQKHSLNIIGELNMVKACTALISDPLFDIGKNTDSFMKVDADSSDREKLLKELRRAKQERDQLENAAKILTQMQVRIAFVGPLIGFGAAQEAAKNNGVPANKSCNDFLAELYDLINNDDIYGNPDLAPEIYHDYSWRQPYGNMVYALLGDLHGEEWTGAAVGTNVESLGMPNLTSDSEYPYINYMQRRLFYDAIAGEDWCLLKALLEERHTYTGKWWGNIKVKPNTNFIGGSEILPVHVTYMKGESVFEQVKEHAYLENILQKRSQNGEQLEMLSSAYDVYNSYEDNLSKNPNDTDLKLAPLPVIEWAVFDSSWQSYADAGISTSDWNGYLRAPFKEGTDYYSGALSYFAVHVPNSSYTNRFKIGNSLKIGGSSGMGQNFNQTAAAAQRAQNTFSTQSHISFDATAKPFGSLKDEKGKTHHPFVAGMILPVFHKVSLIPVSLEIVPGYGMYDYDWVIFLTKYLPALGTVDSIDEVASKLSPKHYARCIWFETQLKKLMDPEFRARGREWLSTVYDWYETDTGKIPKSFNADHCGDWKGGSGGGRYSPKAH